MSSWGRQLSRKRISYTTSTYSITKWALTLILNMTLQDASTAAKLKADYEVAFYRKG